jgi:predicted nucleotidyltransferase
VYLAKDFLETAEGLIFAVVADGHENGKVLCFLRYLCLEGVWRKVDTELANSYLDQYCPQYLHYSALRDAHLHAVPLAKIAKHYQCRQGLQQLLLEEPRDPVLADLHALWGLLQENGLALSHFGVTGSLLVGMQKHGSDIDLVCYDRSEFHRARTIVQALIAADCCQALSVMDWLEAYKRRACDFAFDQYVWHEQRKYNKAMINGRKFDLSLVLAEREAKDKRYRKLGFIRIDAEVSDDQCSFDYPAQFAIRHPQVDSVVCFTATYIGQAQAGERVRVAGQLEVDQHGNHRIVVGASREAIGEFIQVIR